MNKGKKDELSAIVLKGYQISFLRKKLGLEKLVPELGKIRSNYISTVLIPALDVIDTKVMEMRDKNCERTPNGQIKTNSEGEIQYGEKEKEVRQIFTEILSEDVILPIHDKAQFLNIRDIFLQTKQEFDENEEVVYMEIVEKFNSVKIEVIRA